MSWEEFINKALPVHPTCNPEEMEAAVYRALAEEKARLN